MASRSSLELMLDKLQRLEQQPDGIPPPLPVRPVSRARRARLPRPRPPMQDKSLVDHFLKKESGNLKERGICKIQKCYRGHQVRCCYRELTRGVIALQSFIRAQNARRGYKQRCRKYLEHQAAPLTHLHSDPNQIRAAKNTKDQTRVPYASLVDLQKRVVRTEAKLRAKKEENVALKRKLFEMEKKWHKCEERMTSMEKEWQDQLTYIQECLAAAKKNPSPQTRFSNPESLIHIPMNSNNNASVDEDDEDQIWVKLRPHEELRKLKLGFKEWKKEYKNKLRGAQSTLKKLGNSQTSKSHKNWWGRLSN